MSTAKMTAPAKAKLRAEALRRVKRAFSASKRLREDVHWIARHEAWTLFDLATFEEFWEAHNGELPSTFVQVLFIEWHHLDGMNTRNGNASAARGTNGHTLAEVAGRMGASWRGQHSTVAAIITQLRHGVPADRAIKGRGLRTIQEFGDRPYQPTRARASKSSTGAAPEDYVQIAANVKKKVKDWYNREAATDLATPTGVPTAELVRRVLIAHMDKVEAGRKASRRTSRSKGRAA